MIMNYALIDNQSLKVINMVLWDGETNWTPPEGTFAIQVPDDQLEFVTFDWNYIDGEFVAPEPPEEPSTTP